MSLIDNFNTFWYDGKKLSELGAVISERPKIRCAEKDIEFIDLPCKSGAVYIDNKRYKNVEFSVKIRALPSFCQMTLECFDETIKDWLKTEGYKEYRDTYASGYFRKAVVTRIDDVVEIAKNVFETEITFSCMPFRYKDSGTFAITKGTNSNTLIFSLYNYENCESEPVITISGSGTYTITIRNITISAVVDTKMTIDKTKEDFYDKDGNPCSNSVSGSEIPYLISGENVIQIDKNSGSDGFSVDVIPNWRSR